MNYIRTNTRRSRQHSVLPPTSSRLLLVTVIVASITNIRSTKTTLYFCSPSPNTFSVFKISRKCYCGWHSGANPAGEVTARQTHCWIWDLLCGKHWNKKRINYPRSKHYKIKSIFLRQGECRVDSRGAVTHSPPLCQRRPRRGLRSSSSSDFSLPRLRTKFGERAFTYAGPSAWNSLPKDLRAVTDPELFFRRKRLKTHFLVWRSVFAGNTDDSVMHLVHYCRPNRRTINPRMMMMMTMMMITLTAIP